MTKCTYGLLNGETPDYRGMATAQMLAGLSMQLLGNSRAASGAEHLMAHLVEMKPPRFENAHGMHGQCVGVGTYCARRSTTTSPRLPTPEGQAL